MSNLVAQPSVAGPSPESENPGQGVVAAPYAGPGLNIAISGTNSKSRFSSFLQPYSRITSSGAFIPEIDGLRFVAIFAVYVYHVAGDVLRHSPPGHFRDDGGAPLLAVTQILNVGVPLFFVISGFILGLPLALAHLGTGRPVSLKKYLLRRVTRLEPPYILSLLLFFVVKVAASRGAARDLFPNLLASLFYVHNAVYGTPSVINFVAWSLEIEVQFYILAPLLALVFAIRRCWLRRAALVAMLLAATAISRQCPPEGAVAHSLLAVGQYFLAGFLLVELYVAVAGRRSPNWLWDVAWVAGWSLFLALLVRGGAPISWLSPWLILLLYIAAFQGVVAQRFITNIWITTTGGMCYTIYLLHNYLVAGLGMLTERVFPAEGFAVRLYVQLLLLSPFVLIISALYFRWIERPCMRPDWPQRFIAACAQLKARWFPTTAVAGPARAASDE